MTATSTVLGPNSVKIDHTGASHVALAAEIASALTSHSWTLKHTVSDTEKYFQGPMAGFSTVLKYIGVIVEADRVRILAYSDWDEELNSGIDLAYDSDNASYGQPIANTAEHTGTLYLFVHPRYFVAYGTVVETAESGSTVGNSWSGVLEIDNGIGETDSQQRPRFAWANGHAFYGHEATAVTFAAGVQYEPKCFSLCRTLEGSIGEGASLYQQTSTIRNAHGIAYNAPEETCARYTYNDTAQPLAIQRTHEDNLPDKVFTHSSDTPRAYGVYATQMLKGASYVRGEFFGIKLMHVNAGANFDTLDLKIDSSSKMLDHRNGTMAQHMIIKESDGGCFAFPL